jgi:hypothetical protein
VFGILFVTTACDHDESDGPETAIAGGSRGSASASRTGVTEIKPGETIPSAEGRTIYVSAYSHIFTSDDARPFNLAVTLSIRNTDAAQPIVITSVRYYDRDGRLVRDYVKTPLRITPLAAMDFFVKESDKTGGSSASFLVECVSDHPVSDPVAEAVMVRLASSQGVAFVCPGRIVARRSH